MKTRYYVILFFIIIILDYPFAQENNSIKEKIIQRLSQESITGVLNLDILSINETIEKSNRNPYIRNYIDNYGTLKDCSLFSFQIFNSDSSSIKNYIGIFKKEQILWLSSPIERNFNLGNEFYFIGDINKDGKNEILNIWSYGSKDQHSYLCIYSWDGTNATIINTINNDNNEIESYYNPNFRIVDENGDGIYSIIASVLGESILYEWNGIQYQATEGEVKYTFEGYSIANNLSVNISANAYYESEHLKFNYLIKNENFSKQAINFINLEIDCDTIGAQLPEGWNISIMNNLPFCRLSTNIEKHRINPGNFLNGFIIGAKMALPTIKHYYVQAKYQLDENSIDIEDTKLILERFKSNIFNNSVSGFTIAPVPKTTNYLGLVDSLDYFINKSHELGWIKNEQTGAKYINLITSAKNNMNNENSLSARADLSTMKTESVLDSAANLTSEAFALIYYNTEYLLTQIPEEGEIAKNLVKNPDMEIGTVDYWYTNNPYGGAVCTLKVNNNLPISGGYDAKLNISVAGTANDRPLLIVYLKENKELGAVYTFTFNTKVTSGNPAIKYINYGDGLKPFGGTLSGEQEWTFTTTAANNSTDNIAIYIDGTRQSSFTLDNLVYKKVLADNPPVITVQPASVSVNEGETAAFNIAANGAGSLSYQWQKNGTDIPAATEDEYTTPATVISDSGSIFRCVVTNQFGSVTSNEAVLSVIQPGTDTTSVNLVYNPRFENGTTDGYEISNTYGGAEYAFDINTTNPIAGNNDAVLNITQAGTSTDRPLIIIYLNENKVTGETYNFSFKTKVLSGNPAIKYINYGNGLKLFNGTLNGEQTWSFSGTVTNASNNILIYIEGTQAGSFAIDEVEYKKTE